MFRKLIIIALAFVTFGMTQAQTAVGTSRFTDNWSAAVKGGVAAPLKGNRGARGIMGIDLRKQITPTFGLGAEGLWGFNTSTWNGLHSPNAIDGQYLGVYGAVNFMNAFRGYAGAPRRVELEGVAGLGWLHGFYPSSVSRDGNSWATRVGLNLNYNFGSARQWSLMLMPRVAWNMGGHTKATAIGSSSMYDVNHAVFEVTAGIAYHFGNSNGTNSFVFVKTYNQREIDSLNREINLLRARLASSQSDKATCAAQLQARERELEECLNRPKTESVVQDIENERFVFFNVGSAAIQPNQMPVVRMLADDLKAHKGTKVKIQGYASPDGNADFNRALAQRRAQAVRDALLREGVPAADIEATGDGIGHIFDTREWNRVAKCTIVNP